MLRAALDRAQFDERLFRVIGLSGVPGWRASGRAAVPRLPTLACGTLVRFFVIRDAMPRDMLDAALGGAEVIPALERAGLALPEAAGRWRCPVCLTPAAGCQAFSDPLEDPASMNPPDEFVIPISGAARIVDDLAVRLPCELAVDLGCGQGFHALRSMTHAKRCIATDINPRALAFAAANASLNSVSDRIECRLGSFFEPLQDVAGRVDLLTSNPPFVIHPGGHTTALVSPTEGDGMIEHLVRNTPRMLSPGGWGTVIGIWEFTDPADWTSRVRGWLSDCGCDALVLQFQSYTPDEYLQHWVAPEARAAAAPGWRALCERRNIKGLKYGGIIVHKRAGANWFNALFSPAHIRSGSASEQLRAYFNTRTLMQSLASPQALLDLRLQYAAGWRFDPTQPVPKSAPAQASRGLALPLPQAAHFEQWLPYFDGLNTGREVLTQFQWMGWVQQAPDHPTSVRMLQFLTNSGCLDIVA